MNNGEAPSQRDGAAMTPVSPTRAQRAWAFFIGPMRARIMFASWVFTAAVGGMLMSLFVTSGAFHLALWIGVTLPIWAAVALFIGVAFGATALFAHGIAGGGYL